MPLPNEIGQIKNERTKHKKRSCLGIFGVFLLLGQVPGDPWYRVVTSRREARAGRSFSPDEFAIALEQVVAGTAPLDYRDPAQFFSRTCFTRALNDHVGMVLRRLAGGTRNTSPVFTLVARFGGGKTHTLTALHHLSNASAKAGSLPGVPDLLVEAGISEPPGARVGVFVGNAWDPSEGRETPWIDLARRRRCIRPLKGTSFGSRTGPAIGLSGRVGGGPVRAVATVCGL